MELPRSNKLWIVVLLIFASLAVVAIYNVVTEASLRVPISGAIDFLAISSPVAQLLCTFRLVRPSSPGPALVGNLFFGFSLLDGTLITLASTYLQGNFLGCFMEITWSHWFQDKNSKAIRSIQNRLDCCGLRSTLDKAWPFPDKTHDANACVMAYNRDKSCFSGWMSANRKTLVVSLAIGIISLTVKLSLGLFVQLRSERMKSWSAYWQSNSEQRWRTRPALQSAERDDDHYSDETPRTSNVERAG